MGTHQKTPHHRNRGRWTLLSPGGAKGRGRKAKRRRLKRNRRSLLGFIQGIRVMDRNQRF